MFNIKRNSLALLAVLFAALVLFNACAGEKETLDSGTAGTGVVYEHSAQQTIDIFANWEVKLFRVVCPDKGSGKEAAEKAALTISAGITELIQNNLGVKPSRRIATETDWKRADETYDTETTEILVGLTMYPETARIAEGMSYGDYRVAIEGNKIVVFAYTPDALTKAADELLAVLENACDRGAGTISVSAEALEVSSSLDGGISTIPLYEGGTSFDFYKAGGEADEIIIRETNPEEYAAYLRTLEEGGFVCYTERNVQDNLFATYTDKKYTVSAGYYAYEQSARIIVEPLAPAVGLESENPYTKITTSQITMLGLEYEKKDGSMSSNGLSMLIRLEDGRFIVIDGGFKDKAKDHAEMLAQQMREQSKEYAETDADITIAAWIITHSHNDHNGMINNSADTFKKMNVEKFLTNFMAESERQKAIHSTEYGANWSSSEGGGYVNTIKAAEELGAVLHTVRVGQVFYMADVELEVLYTIDSYGPAVCNTQNTTSLVIKMTFGDGTVFICTGDATGDALEIVHLMYGDYLKSDIVTVAHHGYKTYGKERSVMAAYKDMAPSIVLWPQGGTVYPTYRDKEYNVALINRSSNPNYVETYVAGSHGDTVIIPIPFNSENVLVTRVKNSYISGANKLVKK